MAISLKQTGRTAGSVTFSISGFPEEWSQRQTLIWNVIAQKWVSLQDARASGYISSYSATSDTNGSITVYPRSQYAKEYKVWQFMIQEHRDGGLISQSAVLNTILKFEFENAERKYAGKPIDITVNDLRQINLFGMYIRSWITNEDAEYYALEDDAKGDKIWADYLVLPAQNIYNAASQISTSLFSNREIVKAFARKPIENAYSGGPVAADSFNGVMYAINNFNLNC